MNRRRSDNGGIDARDCQKEGLQCRLSIISQEIRRQRMNSGK
jgi:hypothetical protein